MRTTQLKENDSSIGLRKNSVGVFHIVFFIIAAASPLTVVIALFPVIIGSGNGIGIVTTFLAAALVLLIFAVGYVAMSKHVTNAGAFFSYVTLGLGRPLGLGTATLAIFGYTAIQLGLFGGFGYYGSTLVATWFGIEAPWWICSFLAIAGCLAVSMNSIRAGARVLTVLLTVETGVIVVLNIAILFNSPTPVKEFSFDPFAPSTLFAGALGVALMFAHASFIGFEGSAIYGEEARDPKRTIPRATYISVIFMGMFYAITAWLIINSLGIDNAVAVAQEHSGDLIFVVSDTVLGSYMTGIFHVLILTAMFAAILTFHNNIARYLFSLGRQGALPKALGSCHPKNQSPRLANLVQVISVAIGVSVFAIFQLDPYNALFTWMTGIGAVGIMLLQFIAGIAIFVFFRRYNVDKRIWNTIVAPLLGVAGLLVFLYYTLTGIDVLLGTGGALAAFLVGLTFFAFVGGAAWGFAAEKWFPNVYARLRIGMETTVDERTDVKATVLGIKEGKL